MVIFFGRWQKNTAKGVQQTQIIVQDDEESGITVTTIRDGNHLNKGAASIAGAMHIVADIVSRLGEGA